MSNWGITLGIPVPETARAAADEATIAGMRRAIGAAYRDSPIVRKCMMMADRDGLSGEDRYTLLAYHALRALEDQYQETLRLRMQQTAAGFGLSDHVPAQQVKP